MIGFGTSLGKSSLSVEHTQVVAFYDPESGKIKHLHMVTTLAGVKPPTSEEAVEEAKAITRRRKSQVSGLPVALSTNAEHGRNPHSIDLNTKTFVPLPEGK